MAKTANSQDKPATDTNIFEEDKTTSIEIKEVSSSFEVKDSDIEEHEEATVVEPTGTEVAINMLLKAKQVIVIPGYGMAVAQAQDKVWELAKILDEHGVQIKFAIHPVAGRMPGHIDMLLADAGVPDSMIFSLEEINAEFAQTDVAFVIGANDVINPEIWTNSTNSTSSIYGIPLVNVDKAKNVIVLKRGQGFGFTGIGNRLIDADNVHKLYGDAQKTVAELLKQIKS